MSCEKICFHGNNRSKPIKKVNGMRKIVNVLVSVLSTLALVNCANKSSIKSVNRNYKGPSISIHSDIYKKVEFIDNSKTNPSYLSVNVFYSPLTNVRSQIEQWEKRPLVHRGEGHITVLTPDEYQQLITVLSGELINEVALLNRIQQVPFEVVCVGRGHKQEANKTLYTYFIVINSSELIRIREALQTLYITRGGRESEFIPEIYQPHITIGFTERDLHAHDGVEKNKSSCYSEIQLKAQ